MRDIDFIRQLNEQKQEAKDFDEAAINSKNFMNQDEQIAQQIEDLNELDADKDAEDEEMPSVDEEDSDAEEMRRLINYEESGENEMSDDDMDEDSEEGEQEVDEDGSSSDDSEKPKTKKRTLKERMKEEQAIRDKEKSLRSGDSDPKDIDDFERLLIANQDQSYLWIQYMAFMLDNVDINAARSVAQRAVKSVAISNEQDKLNIWTAYMNLESNFGTQESLEQCAKKALEVNERKKVYLNLIDIYKTSLKYQFIEPIYKQLCKKFSNNLDIWSAYIEFLIEMSAKQDEEFLAQEQSFSDPK